MDHDNEYKKMELSEENSKTILIEVIKKILRQGGEAKVDKVFYDAMLLTLYFFMSKDDFSAFKVEYDIPDVYDLYNVHAAYAPATRYVSVQDNGVNDEYRFFE